MVDLPIRKPVIPSFTMTVIPGFSKSSAERFLIRWSGLNQNKQRNSTELFTKPVYEVAHLYLSSLPWAPTHSLSGLVQKLLNGRGAFISYPCVKQNMIAYQFARMAPGEPHGMNAEARPTSVWRHSQYRWLTDGNKLV